MRPRILTLRLIVVAFAIGVVLTVASVPVAAVSCELGWPSEPTPTHPEMFRAQDHFVVVTRYEHPLADYWTSASYAGERAAVAENYAILDGARRVIADPRPGSARPRLDGQYIHRSWCGLGWPLRSAYMVQDADSTMPAGQWVGVWRAKFGGSGYTIPLLPHWPGLLGSAFFYSMLVLASVVLLRWLCLHRRTKRNQCLACGYESVEGVETCPECGLAAARR